jgi:CheY-like chemotaxis protein
MAGFASAEFSRTEPTLLLYGSVLTAFYPSDKINQIHVVEFARSEDEMSPLSASRQSVSVLVVEDEIDTRESLATLLQTCGHTVRIAPDAKSALQIVAEAPPDAVLIDIGLPGMDGYELAQELRRRPWARRPLLIAATGYGTNDARRRSFEAGIDLHYVKPLDPCELDSLLKNTAQISSYAMINNSLRELASAS